MWRPAIVCSCFVLIVIAILALQRPALVFSPAATASRSVNDDALTGQAENGSPLDIDTETTLGYLSNLWRRWLIIKEWMLEIETTPWERFRLARGAERNLIEAQYHVANAEVFGAAIGDIQSAETELDRADRYLQQALPLVSEQIQPTVEAIRKALTDAKIDLEMAAPDTDTSDEQIKSDLDWAIISLHRKQL